MRCMGIEDFTFNLNDKEVKISSSDNKLMLPVDVDKGKAIIAARNYVRERVFDKFGENALYELTKFSNNHQFEDILILKKYDIIF